VTALVAKLQFDAKVEGMKKGMTGEEAAMLTKEQIPEKGIVLE
jgi:hypothetical protein